MPKFCPKCGKLLRHCALHPSMVTRCERCGKLHWKGEGDTLPYKGTPGEFGEALAAQHIERLHITIKEFFEGGTK